MNKMLFIDDERTPSMVWPWMQNDIYLQEDAWDVVRTYEEFEDYINTNGLPQVVSFDNDLGNGKEGVDCADFLIKYCQENGEIDLPNWYVHSMNNVAQDAIPFNLRSYEKYLRKTRN